MLGVHRFTQKFDDLDLFQGHRCLKHKLEIVFFKVLVQKYIKKVMHKYSLCDWCVCKEDNQHIFSMFFCALGCECSCFFLYSIGFVMLLCLGLFSMVPFCKMSVSMKWVSLCWCDVEVMAYPPMVPETTVKLSHFSIP